MRIYAAGGITGNLKGIFKQVKIHLAENDGYRKLRFKLADLNILESYYYIRTQEWMFPLLKTFNSFMLDSGVFTFLNSPGVADKIDFESYCISYAEFIRDQKIELFIELDTDSFTGIKKVESMRNKIEKIVQKQCIPVWHRSRGWKYWIQMCKEYKYIAIGGMVNREIEPKDYPIFTKMLRYAHDRGVKVHGLGFTNYKGILKYRFDSVDSTAWLYGNRGGFLYRFNGKGLDKIQSPKGVRLKPIESAIHNFTEWVKFSKFAEVNL